MSFTVQYLFISAVNFLVLSSFRDYSPVTRLKLVHLLPVIGHNGAHTRDSIHDGVLGAVMMDSRRRVRLSSHQCPHYLLRRAKVDDS